MLQSKFHLSSSNNVMWFSSFSIFFPRFYVYSSFFTIYVTSTIDEASRKELCNEGSVGKIVLEILKEIYHHLLLYPMNFLTYILMVSVLLHHLWLLMSLMNCCGPLMEMRFMCSALNFSHLILRFLLINFLLIPFNCILILISFLFILLYYILKQLVILVGIF
jgi:hypothetical protein